MIHIIQKPYGYMWEIYQTIRNTSKGGEIIPNPGTQVDPARLTFDLSHPPFLSILLPTQIINPLTVTLPASLEFYSFYNFESRSEVLLSFYKYQMRERSCVHNSKTTLAYNLVFLDNKVRGEHPVINEI